MEDCYVVYVHISPIGLRYYGITSRDVKKRWKNGKGYIHNQYFYRAIQKYGWDSFTHEILAQGLNRQDACAMEEQLIAEYNTQDPRCGYNLSAGGECNKLSQATKDKISAANKGKVRAEDVRKRIALGHIGISTSLKGRKLSPEHKYKVSRALRGRKYPHGATSAKPVVCDGVRYDSVQECADVYGVSFSAMCAWLRGEKSMPYKFVSLGLSYVGVEAAYNERLDKNVKAVEYDGKCFDSVSECARYIGVDNHYISRWIDGKVKMPENIRQRGLRYIPRLYYIVTK